ncbi:hypothetical protein D9M71_320100 [compost metagenome]
MVVAHQAGEDLGFAVMQTQGGLGVAGIDLDRNGALSGRCQRRGVTDFQRDLDRHFVVQVHDGLHFELQTDVEVGHAFGDHRALGRRHRGGADDRHALTDVDARLLAVADADNRTGQGIHVGVLVLDLRLDAAVDADAAAVVQTLQLRQRGWRATRIVEHGEGVRPLQPEIADALAVHFHHLHFQHHFRVGLVLRIEQLLRQPDGVRGIAHGQGVEALVDEHVAGLEHGLDHVQRGVGVDVGQVEGAHHQLLVILGFLRRVGVDQDGVLVHHFLVQLVLLQQQFHGVLDAYIAYEDGGLEFGAQVLVEDEVQPCDLGQHLEDDLEVGIAKLQGDRPLQACAQLRVGYVGAALDLIDGAAHFQGAFVLGIQIENVAHLAVGPDQVAAAQVGLGLDHARIEGAQVLELAQ